MEIKSLQSGTTSISDRQVTGIAAVFGNIDDGNDRMWPGSFSKTIQEGRKRFRHLWNHAQWDPPIATVDGLKEVNRAGLPAAVLSYAPDAVGGLEVVRTYLDTPRGNEVLAGIKAEAIDEMSFGYDAIPGKMAFVTEGDKEIRDLYEVRLWDTSDVNWGMNAATTTGKELLYSLPLDILLKHLEAFLSSQSKVGARNSMSDMQMLNTIHKMSVDLGATDCLGSAANNANNAPENYADTQTGKSRAETSEQKEAVTSLTQDPVQLLAFFEFLSASNLK